MNKTARAAVRLSWVIKCFQPQMLLITTAWNPKELLSGVQ
jgi:hypothetical protein